MTASKDTPAINSALAELRKRRLAKERVARAAQADELAKYQAQAATDKRDLLGKIEQIDRTFADVQRLFVDVRHRLDVIEKSRSALAVQPPCRELTSWSPERLAGALRDMSPAEIAKLLQ